jgi:hypothetical protein
VEIQRKAIELASSEPLEVRVGILHGDDLVHGGTRLVRRLSGDGRGRGTGALPSCDDLPAPCGCFWAGGEGSEKAPGRVLRGEDSKPGPEERLQPPEYRDTPGTHRPFSSLPENLAPTPISAIN